MHNLTFATFLNLEWLHKLWCKLPSWKRRSREQTSCPFYSSSTVLLILFNIWWTQTSTISGNFPKTILSLTPLNLHLLPTIIDLITDLVYSLEDINADGWLLQTSVIPQLFFYVQPLVRWQETCGGWNGITSQR